MCSRVAILAGAGARGAGDEVERLAETLGAPIVKPSLGKDCVPDDSPYVAGGIGAVGTRPSQEAMDGCDALVIVGSSFPFIDFLPAPGQAVCVQIDDRPERIGLRYPADVGLVGDARATLVELLPLLTRNEDRAFLTAARRSASATPTAWRRSTPTCPTTRAVRARAACARALRFAQPGRGSGPFTRAPDGRSTAVAPSLI